MRERVGECSCGSLCTARCTLSDTARARPLRGRGSAPTTVCRRHPQSTHTQPCTLRYQKLILARVKCITVVQRLVLEPDTMRQGQATTPSVSRSAAMPATAAAPAALSSAGRP